jgi:hypothetical protein
LVIGEKFRASAGVIVERERELAKQVAHDEAGLRVHPRFGKVDAFKWC